MADKSLGQHWLFDKATLKKIADMAEVQQGDVVLEIGPGLGTLTHEILSRGASVIAVELDDKLASDLELLFKDKDFTLHSGDILEFDFTRLPENYKIVANIPYYLTSHLLRIISESSNPPHCAALLVQKEVAERAAATYGNNSILSISLQVYADVIKGAIVPAAMFSPPPKIDSQILALKFYDKPLVADHKTFFRIVKAGFSQPRKKLRNSLAGGLGISVESAEKLLSAGNIDPNLRAEIVTVTQWIALSMAYRESN